MTTTERAAEIRKALKAQGITSRDVSVRSDYFSMGSSIDVSIKNPRVALGPVKQIAEAHESISRCSVSGEILSGGNRYVHVAYAPTAIQALTAPLLPYVERALATLEAEGPTNSLIPLDNGSEYLLGRSNLYTISIWNEEGFFGQASTAAGAAETIALAEAKWKR
jgi:hypothetical protein